MTISNVLPIDAVVFPPPPLPPLAAPSELANAAGSCSIGRGAALTDARPVAGRATETRSIKPSSSMVSVGKRSGEFAAPSSWNLFFLINENPPVAGIPLHNAGGLGPVPAAPRQALVGQLARARPRPR